MANKRVGTLEMRLRLETGEVEPIDLGVTLPDFTEWVLPYILIKDEDTDRAGWHDVEGLERVCHTDDLPDHAKGPIQFLITKPLQKAQTYLPVWQDAYSPWTWWFSWRMISAHPWGCMWHLCSMG